MWIQEIHDLLVMVLLIFNLINIKERCKRWPHPFCRNALLLISVDLWSQRNFFQQPGLPNWYSDWLRAGRPRGRSSSLGRVKNFLHVVQTGSGVHPTSYPMGTGALSLGVERPVREADHLPPTSAEFKNMWTYTSTPTYAFMA
jgi:hypothetical protein